MFFFRYNVQYLFAFECLTGSIASERMRYVWTQDEVQTARISFYLRVLPACISLVPTAMFGERIAPTMFLYPL